jgi:hypothetical protein
MVKNFWGWGRVEVWDEGDVADLSDLTEDERGRRLPAQEKGVAGTINFCLYQILYLYTCNLSPLFVTSPFGAGSLTRSIGALF